MEDSRKMSAKLANVTPTLFNKYRAKFWLPQASLKLDQVISEGKNRGGNSNSRVMGLSAVKSIYTNG
ncbi:hypothetical protein D3C81_1271700 [compost metagenome]